MLPYRNLYLLRCLAIYVVAMLQTVYSKVQAVTRYFNHIDIILSLATINVLHIIYIFKLSNFGFLLVQHLLPYQGISSFFVFNPCFINFVSYTLFTLFAHICAVQWITCR